MFGWQLGTPAILIRGLISWPRIRFLNMGLKIVFQGACRFHHDHVSYPLIYGGVRLGLSLVG